MSINQGQLQGLLQELTSSHRNYTAQLQATLGSLRSIERDDAVLKATVIELKSSTTGNEPVWRGVGKMFLSTPVDDYVGELEQQQKENKDRKSAIEKKKDYFEVSVQKVEDSLKQIIGNKN